MENLSSQFFLKKPLPTKLVLVGFSGAGKSFVGKKIASKLDYPFIDLDRYFEEKYRFTIFDFFERFGEELFRKLEHDALMEVLQREPAVIATGGGTPCFFDNMSLINATATSVYLQMSNKSLCERLLRAKRPRPLTKTLSPDELSTYVEQQMQIRSPFYQQAHYALKGENFSIKTLFPE